MMTSILPKDSDSCDDDLTQSDSENSTGQRESGGSNNNMCVMDESNMTSGSLVCSDSCNNTVTVGTGHSRERRRVSFSDDFDGNSDDCDKDSDDEVQMVPPVKPSHVNVCVALQPVDSVLPEGMEDNVSYDNAGNEAFSDYEVGGAGKNTLFENVGVDIHEKMDEVKTVSGNIFDKNPGGHENGDGPNTRDDGNFFDVEDYDDFPSGQSVEIVQKSDSYSCQICDKTFKVEYKFKAHLASTHFKAKLDFEFNKFGRCCPFCKRTNMNMETNMKHIGETHEKVYDYYEEIFGDGTININKCRSYKSKLVPTCLSGEHGGKSPTIKANDARPTSLMKPPLRGILKKSNSKSEEKQSKSILRSSSPKYPPPCPSILKPPRTTTKQVQKPPSFSAANIGKTQPPNFQNCINRKIVLSIQNDVGDQIIDLV